VRVVPGLTRVSPQRAAGARPILGCVLFTASMAFAVRFAARLSLDPTRRRRLSRRGRLRFTLRTARLLPLPGLSTLRFDAGRFPPTPAVCYRALWRLPGPDSHR